MFVRLFKLARYYAHFNSIANTIGINRRLAFFISISFLRSYALHIPPEYSFVKLSESFGNSVDLKKIDTFYTKYKTCDNRNITPNPALKLIVTNNDPKYVVKIMSECLTILNKKPIINTHHQQMVIEILAASLPGFLDKCEKEEMIFLEK